MAHPLAGQPAPQTSLTDILALLAAYRNTPDVSQATQRVAFGTSGHRGSALHGSFNEAHILAIAQAVAEYRTNAGITGPLFLGMDTTRFLRPRSRPRSKCSPPTAYSPICKLTAVTRRRR